MNFVEWLEAEAARLNESADRFESGTAWVGDTLTPSQTERDEAAAAMRESADRLLKIAERNKNR